ncbi:MAG: amino acid permease [Pseudomonadota bacterium]
MSPVPAPLAKPLGFWSCWSLTVGIMIGSGIFLLPSVLAPYGLMSFAGWALTGTGSICLALIIARLSSRTSKSGGVYRYTRDAFGDLAGFLIAWGYWAAYWIAMPAIAIAFVGYFGVFVPALKTNSLWQAAVALVLIWTITFINLRGVREAGFFQLTMTVLKLVPLALIIGLAAFTGDTSNLPALNPRGESILPLLAATALLTMWAFSGLEAGAMPAGDVIHPEKTIPRAIIAGTVTVTFVYVASTGAVMLLVPAETLVGSTSPFADAARGLGAWGPAMVAIGAMISTVGTLNGTIFITGQLPMAVALDGLAPKAFKQRNLGGTQSLSLLIGSALASVLLLANYTRGLVEVFTFLIMMSTATILVPLFVSALAEFRVSWTSQKAWASLAGLVLLYTVFTILGSGLSVLAWGCLLFAVGIPVYYFGKPSKG